MKIVILISVLFFSCQSNSQNPLQEQDTKLLTKKEIVTRSLYKQVLIDTLIHFDDFKNLMSYKRNIDSIYRKNILNNDSISDFHKETIAYKNSILTQYAVFNFLNECDKSKIGNFNFLNFIINSTEIFSQQQLIDLFNSFPTAYKNSTTGKKYLKVINSRNKNIGRSIEGVKQSTMKTVDGNVIDLASLMDNKYQFYIILFTASWCGPCRHYSQLYKSRLEKIDSAKVKIISISIDTDEKRWEQFMKEEDYKWNCFIDSKGFRSDILKYFGFNSIPKYFLIDKKGKVLAERSGDGMDSILKEIQIKLI